MHDVGYLRQAWLVIALAVGSAILLTGVQAALQPLIERNRLEETLERIPELVPGAETGARDTLAGAPAFRAMAGERQVGWVLAAGGPGFADRIDVLIGLDSATERITGLYVLDQKETPGLGNRIVEPAWRAQFAGKSTALALHVGNGVEEGRIDAITGATISSESVCEIINRALARMRALNEE